MSSVSPFIESAALRRRRRLSAPATRRPSSRTFCHPLPPWLEALDLHTASPVQTLASLRYLVLSYLAELETKLSELESPTPDTDSWRLTGELTIEEARQWAQTALEMLASIRTDVCSHLPDFPDFSESVENLKARLPDLPDVVVPSIDDVRSHLPDMPHMSMPNMSDLRSKLDDVRTRFHDIDLSFVPKLSEHLHNLHQHLASVDGVDSSHTLGSMLSDFIDKMLYSDMFSDILAAAPSMVEREDMLERKAREVARAVKRSFEGMKLIKYSDLPQPWRNNPFVTHGYRFIPIERWPLIVMSLFAFHNETLNIHTHLIPFVLWTINSIPYINPEAVVDVVETVFMIFALLCLLSSAIWHTMSGCAHSASMDFCARVDYVGIGWLISASVATVVHYAFHDCHDNIGYACLSLCLITGILGTVCPFMAWFNDPVYRNWRILFFLCLAFSALGPLVALISLHSAVEVFHFLSPVIPSLVSYITGLVFYASHVPERWLPEKYSRKLDFVGGGSHCIWHCFIVLAVSQHKTAIRFMKDGLDCPAV